MNTTEDILINYLLAVIEGVVTLDLNSVAQGLQQCRINFQTWNGVSALTLAINSDKIGIPVLKMILDAGFELNGVVTDGKGHTLIMKALLLGVSCDKIRYLVERGADIKFTLQEGNALHFAVKGGNLETLEFLLNYGIDVNDRSNGMSPIDLAVEEYRFKVLEYLLKQKIQPPIINSTPEHKISHPLHCVAIRKFIADSWTVKFYSDMVDLLCDAGVDLNDKEGNYSALTYSIMARKHQATLKLLERGAKVNDVDVFSACEGKMLFILNKLIEHGANVKALSKKGRTTVHAVLANPSIKNGPVVTFKPQDPQTIGQMLSILAQHGVDFNHVDDDGIVPLMLVESAAQFRMLEQYGANPSIKIKGENLLHLLLENQKIDAYTCAAQKLRGLVNEKDRYGLTPLLLCLTTLRSDRKYNFLASYVDFVRVLIENGADIDVVDKNGRSAIFYAIYSSDIELIELLLSHGASMTIRDKKGNNILHEVASMNEAEEIFAVLVKYASRELILELLDGKNKKSDYPEDLAKDKGMEYLFKEKITLASRRGVNIFEFEKLFPAKIAKLRNGYQLKQAEISHECMIDLQPVDSFLHLPHEVVLAIMKFSTIETVVALSTTCRQLKIWSDDNTLWRELLTRKYDTCQSVIKCQNVKQELAKRWNADLNMRGGEYFVYRIKDEGSSCYSTDYDAEHQILAYISSVKLVVLDMSTMNKLFEVSSNNNEWELAHPRVRIFAKQKQIICSFGERVTFINLETGLEEDVPGLLKSNDFYCDGDLVAFEIDNNGTIQVWNWMTKTILLELKATAYWDRAHYPLVLVNGKLARMIGQAQVDIWDVNTGKRLIEVEGRTIDRLDKYIIVGDYDINRPRVYYDTETGREMVRNKFTVEDLKTKMIATLDKEVVTVYEYNHFEDNFDTMKIIATKRISRCEKLGALHGNLLFAFVREEIEVYEAHSLHKLYSTKYLSCAHHPPPAMTVRDHFLFVNVRGALAILNFNL